MSTPHFVATVDAFVGSRERVVVRDRHPVLACQYGRHQIGDAPLDAPGPDQAALRVERTLPGMSSVPASPRAHRPAA
jgi:hypothetical protein